jgi:hypothetical protein
MHLGRRHLKVWVGESPAGLLQLPGGAFLLAVLAALELYAFRPIWFEYAPSSQ